MSSSMNVKGNENNLLFMKSMNLLCQLQLGINKCFQSVQSAGIGYGEILQQ